MAQRATVDVSLRADISNLVDNLSKVEGLTKAQARKMVRQVERSYKDQTKAAKATAEAQIKAARGVGKETKKMTDDTLDVLQKSATEISSVFGVGLLGDLEGLFDIARQSSEKFGAGAIAAFAGGAGAAALLVAGLAQAVEAQRALNREVAASADGLQGFVSSELLQRLQGFEGQITTIDKTLERMSAETLLNTQKQVIGVETAFVGLTDLGLPTFFAAATGPIDGLAERLSFMGGRLPILSLAFQKLSEAIGDAGRAQIAQTQAAETATASLETQATMLEALGMLVPESTKELDKESDARAKAAQTAKDEAQAKADLVFQTEMLADRERKEHAAAMLSAEQKEEQARIIKDVARLEALQASALGELMTQEEKAVQKAAARVEEMTNLSRSLGDNADATLGLAAASEALKQAQQDQDAALQTEKFEKLSDTISAAAGHMLELTDSMSTFANLALDKLTEIADKERARQEAAIESDAARKKASIEQQLESGKIDDKQAEARMRNVDRLAEADKRRIEGLTDQQKKQAKKAFAAQQALALAEVAINAAAAYLPLVGGLAYLGFGAPAAAAGITGAAALAQTAAILSAKPPEFASGGMVGARLSADHALIAAQPDEGIVSRRGIAALGGPDGLDQLNRGAGMGASITANIMLDRQMLGRVVAEVAPSARNTAPGRVQIYGGH